MQRATGTYCTYSIPGKTATLVPVFAMEDLPLSRTLMMMMMIQYIYKLYQNSTFIVQTVHGWKSMIIETKKSINMGVQSSHLRDN